MGKFLEELKGVFQDLDKNLSGCLQYEDKQLQYFKRFFKILSEESRRMLLGISQLGETNRKVQVDNSSSISKIKHKVDMNLRKTKELLAGIDIKSGPVQHKCQIVKNELDKHYQILEDQILLINQFEALYLRHTNRIKKILLVSFISFMHFQKRCLNFGRINDKNLSDRDYDIGEEMFIAE